MSIIKKINNNFSKKKKQFKKFFDNKKNYKIVFDKKNPNVLYLNYKKESIKAEFNFLGIYKIDSTLWMWADIIPGVNTTLLKSIELIKKSSFMFESLKNKEIQFLHQAVSKDSILITDEKYLDTIIKVSIYLTNGLFVLTPISSKNYSQFLMITNIISS